MTAHKIITMLFCAFFCSLCAPAAAQLLLPLAMSLQTLAPYGFVDKTGKQVIDFRKEKNIGYSLSEFSDDRSILFSMFEQKAFVIDKTGQKIGQTFRSIQQYSEGLAAAVPLEAKLDERYTEPFPMQTLKHYLWGYADKNGNLKIKDQYREAMPFKEGLAAVKPLNSENWGFIDKDGKLQIPAVYERVGEFSEGLIPVCQNKKWGLIDKTGSVVLPPTYKEPIGPFRNGLASVYAASFDYKRVALAQTAELGAIDKNAFEIKEVRYINKQGQVILTVTPSPDLSKTFIRLDDLNVVRAWNGKDCRLTFGWESKAGFDFSENLAVLRSGEKYGYIDSKGQFLIAPQFDYAWPFKEGRARVYKDVDGGKYSFIDKSGATICPYEFAQVQDFSEGLALVCKSRNGKSYFIDSSGVKAPLKKQDYVGSFHNGLALIGHLPVWP